GPEQADAANAVRASRPHAGCHAAWRAATDALPAAAKAGCRRRPGWRARAPAACARALHGAARRYRRQTPPAQRDPVVHIATRRQKPRTRPPLPRPYGPAVSDGAGGAPARTAAGGRLPGGGPNQIRRTAIEPLVPPKPKELEIATLIFMSRAVLAQ